MHEQKLRWYGASAVAILLNAGLSLHANAAPTTNRLQETRLREPARTEVFVRLQTPSVAEANADALRTQGSFLDAATQRQRAAAITQEQAGFAARLRGMGLNPRHAQRVGANGVRVEATATEIAQLRAMSEVRSVAKVERHVHDNIDSVPWIGAPAAWASGYTGKGISIAVIDTGIDYTHADFGGSGNVADYESNDPNAIEAGTFPTTKVAGGFDFAGAAYDADDPDNDTPAPDADPLDVQGHGSHVAGTAAGIGVDGSVGAGVAKDAKLYALKVFGDGEGSTELTSLAIEWAMDPNGDGDMSDHLDVINMSLGSPFGSPDDPSSISADNAVATGIVVVTSAGNENNVPYVTGAPGVAAHAISTAASIPGGRDWARFMVTAPPAVQGTYPSEEGAGPVRFEDGAVSGALVPGEPRNGCAPLTNAAAVAGKIALIIRGTCDFLVKYTNAQNAGALAIVVYNDGTSSDRVEPIVMGGLDDTIHIPGLMIAFSIGNTLASTAGVQVTIDAVADPTRDDRITEFSSRGPGHGGSTFKPDLAAPGFSIASAGVGTGTAAALLDGTSMAAPHVAGAAALLLQKWPSASPEAIKALLQNSTVPANTAGDTDIARQGVGIVRVDRAIALSSYASPGGVSFGRINRAIPQVRTEHVTIKNLGKTRRSFNVQHIPGQQYPGVQVQCPAHVAVGPGGRATLRVGLVFDPTRAARAGVADDASISQSEVDGWCVLSDGQDSLRVAYLAVVDAASHTLARAKGRNQLDIVNLGPANALAEGFTWAADNGEVAAAQGTTAGIFRVGYRTADPALYFDEPVLELGIATDAPWEHLSDLRFDVFLDTDGNGTDDVHLAAADLAVFADVDPGDFVTAQFEVGGEGSLDWLVTTWDFNDRVVILPFTKLGGTAGRVPAAFEYRLEVTGPDGSVDVQRGAIDTSQEIGLDLNSFGLDPFDNATIHVTRGAGSLLWLYPNDSVQNQADKLGPVKAK